MEHVISIHLRRAALLAGAALSVATAASASRVAGSPPAASAVQSSPQQPAPQQADESASLRQGIVTAIDEARGRIQVHGLWLQLAADTTKLVRNGRPAAFDTLKVGETIRFALASDPTGNRTVRLIYAP